MVVHHISLNHPLLTDTVRVLSCSYKKLRHKAVKPGVYGSQDMTYIHTIYIHIHTYIHTYIHTIRVHIQ